MKFIKQNGFILLFIGIVLYFFLPFLLHGLLPIPADTIVGLYNPYRDFYAATNPHGIAFKNFLITDPIRQIYPWKELAVNTLKMGQLPLWNPYAMSGTPLAANFQSSPYYPLNIFLFILPFATGWSILIMLQPLLSGLFLYFYLRNLKLNSHAAIFGAIVFAFCGFSVAWLEWNTIVQTVLWLPLILLCIDKLSECSLHGSRRKENFKFQISNFKFSVWIIIFIVSLVSSFLAGHLQSFFYLYIVVIAYFIIQWVQNRKKLNVLLLFILLNSVFIILTAIQWYPTLQFIVHSARNIDQADWAKPEWFLPWQNLAQFLVPDFFGNPTTLNYWGIWNYGEFVGYIGLIPFIMSLFALLFRRDKKTLFFGILLLTGLIFSLPTPIAKIPFMLHIPFLSTSQPTRLMFVVDFALAILSALGLDFFLKGLDKKSVKLQWNIIIASLITILCFGVLWMVILFNAHLFMIDAGHLIVARRNLLFQSLLLVVSIVVLLLSTRINRKSFQKIILIVLFLISAADVVRFAQKFEPFSKKEYLYPNTKSLTYLSQQTGLFRIAATDSRLLPPNFPVAYKLQSIEGYDPLYLLNYGEYIASLERNKPDISGPFGFNRIITPRNISSPLFDLLNVKYVLSFEELDPKHFVKVFQEGETKVFENKKIIPRAFFVKSILSTSSKYDAINKLFQNINNLNTMAVVENALNTKNYEIGTIQDISYTENKIVIHTKNLSDGFLVFTDTYYPTWHATINNKEAKIYKTDYTFRGLEVSKGNNTIVFSDTLF